MEQHLTRFWVSDAAVGQLVIFLTTLLGILFQVYRENRARKWMLEDRAHQEKMEEDRKKFRTDISEKLEENTQISVRAFTEANNVNSKIATIGQGLIQTNELVKNLAERPVIPALPIRVEDAKEALDHRDPDRREPLPMSERRKSDHNE